MRLFTDVDLKTVKNIRTALLQGRFELSGIECLEMAKMLSWCEEMHSLMNEHIQQVLDQKMAEPRTFERAREKRKKGKAQREEKIVEV